MRFRLQLHINKQRHGDTLPFNYQYECSAVIYKIMARSDAAFAAWLHDNGFQSDRKQFKLFTYSRLHIPQYQVKGNNMKILSDTIEWYISFLPEISTQQFIQGIFSEQTIELGNKFNKIQCAVKSIEVVAPPHFTDTLRFSTLSPACVVLKHSDKSEEYIAPDHPEAARLILQNLLDKYRALNGTEYPAENIHFTLKTLTIPKPVLITIKAGTLEESRIRGFMGQLDISAPEPLMKIMYDGGIGSKSSMGFGCVEVGK